VASCSAGTSAAAVVAAVGYTATFAGDGLAFGSADNGPLVRAAGQDVL